MRYLVDEAYKKFNERLVQTKYEIIGVRVPVLRQMAKQMIKDGQWQQVLLEQSKYHEDVQLSCFILSTAPMMVKERQQALENFFPYMDNWQVVDGLCSGLKETKKHPQLYWDWLKTLRASGEPFVIRFVVVMYLSYFLESEHLEDVLVYFESITDDHYYVKMAIAWALSIAFIKDEARLTQFFVQTKLDKWTYNKALQKIIESRQISEDVKMEVRSWKRL